MRSICTLTFAFMLLLVRFSGGAPQAMGAPFTAGGVCIDAEGVVRTEPRIDPQLAEVRRLASKGAKDEKLVYISLPKLFESLRRAGGAVPVTDLYLGGMVKLQYVFVFPEEQDLVIAGPAEPFNANAQYRPLGQVTGRPVLHLDDLVTAFRACGPAGSETALGCDLQMTAEIAGRIREKTREIQPKLPEMGERRASEAIARAAGTQPVRFFGVPPDSRFGIACIEADYQLKQLRLGILKSPVKGVRSHVSMATQVEPALRSCFESRYDQLTVSADGTAYELKGFPLKVVCSVYSVEGQHDLETPLSSAARAFTDQCNRHLEKLCREIPSFADLINLSDLTVLCALIAKDKLHERVGWDVSWISDPKGYVVGRYPAVKNAATLCAYRRAGAYTIFSTGGILLQPEVCLGKRVVEAGGRLQGLSDRPVEGWCSFRSVK